VKLSLFYYYSLSASEVEVRIWRLDSGTYYISESSSGTVVLEENAGVD
jgi:hypothetical protein